MQLLDTVERLPRSGRTAAAATALPLIILPALGPGLPPGFLETDGMPPVPDKARTGRFFGRRVMEFQNWTLASNAPVAFDRRAAGAAVAGRVSQLPHPLHDEERSHRAQPLQPREANNDRPRTPIPQYDPAGNPVQDKPYF